MGVSKNRGVYPPKWMVYNGKPYEQMDDLGVLFLETSICSWVSSLKIRFLPCGIILIFPEYQVLHG